MTTQAKKGKRKPQVVRDWAAMPLETIADVRVLLSKVLRLTLQRKLDLGVAKTAADVARAILKTHELERSVPNEALAGLARLMAAVGQSVVQNPGESMGSPGGDEVPDIEGEIRDSTCGAAELQNGNRETPGSDSGVAK